MSRVQRRTGLRIQPQYSERQFQNLQGIALANDVSEDAVALSTTTASSLTQRRSFSRRRLEELARKLRDLPEVTRLPELCIYATGSYARNEASAHSDIDLFFIHTGSSRDEARVSRLDELSLFAKVIEVGKEMGFPTFSNDGEFLRIIYHRDILEMMGGREDDYLNFFTARMLLLLESVPLVNLGGYDYVLDEIIDAYFRDYPDHSGTFKPVFLINDVLRFWKTLCLNYENKRNRPDANKEQRRRQQVKNFKLKFSRLMTCYGTIVGVCASSAPIGKGEITALARQVPLDRFLKVTDSIEEIAELRAQILEDYHWFLKFTALSSEELTGKFEISEKKREMFGRADTFGEKISRVLEYFADKNGYKRFLLV